MRKQFEESKEEKLQEITDDGMKCKEAIDALREKSMLQMQSFLPFVKNPIKSQELSMI